VPKFYGAYSVGSSYAIMLERFEGSLLVGYKFQSEQEKEVFRSVSWSLLQKLHEYGVYHLDISSCNVMWKWSAEEPRIVYIDFGCAQFAEDAKNRLKPLESWKRIHESALYALFRECGLRKLLTIKSLS
jgi:tRNA A-37 threonylcarbamoyl transferase component Bud32